MEIKPFTQQVYAGLKPARLVGYDGISPGPTIIVPKGTESVVRFVNNGDRENSVHLHGSPSRAPFDGWAEDVTPVGGYKDYYYPNFQSARLLWYHDHAMHFVSVDTRYTSSYRLTKNRLPRMPTSVKPVHTSSTIPLKTLSAFHLATENSTFPSS
jgi:hypothetical protein